MGLFSFIADKGAQLFGMKTDAQDNTEKAQKITEFVTKMGFSVENFTVTVDDTKATLTGLADSGVTREKVILAVGNVEGISQVDDQLTVSAQTPEAQFYTVKGGDSLSKIAKEFYGDPMKYPQIFDANKPMLSHPDKIYPGQTLRIPKTEGLA